MLGQEQIPKVVGSTVYGNDGEKIGKVQQVYVDDRTGEPAFATVHTGLFGRNESFVPIGRAELQDEGLTVPYSKDEVKAAPNVSPDDQHLEPTHERLLFSHYGSEDRDSRPSGTSGGPGTDGPARSKETVELDSVEQQGGGRLRRYLITEYETRAVPVRSEQVEVDEDPTA